MFWRWSRGREFIFLYDDANRTETLRMLGRFAADPDIDFSWYDAAVLSKRIRDSIPAVPARKTTTIVASRRDQ
ncbi:MAG: hypothetical protein R3C05_21110 [Pirellulaceae bacterium]